MAEKKFIIGGEMGFTIQPKAYESINISSTFTIETDSKLTQEELDAYEKKINNILKKQTEKRTREAFKHYTETLQKIKKEAGY